MNIHIGNVGRVCSTNQTLVDVEKWAYTLWHLPLWLRWHCGVAVVCGTFDQKSWVRVSAGHYGVKILGKFLTHMCRCHQAV